MAPLHQWITSQGDRVVVSSAVDPVSDRSSGVCGDDDRTIYATSPISRGDELVRLERGAFLNGSSWLETVNWSEDVDKLKAEIAVIQPSAAVVTVLALLAERARGKNSAFFGYLEQLPQKVNLPLTWDAKSKAMLKHTAAFPIIDDELVANVFKRFAQPLATKFPDLWPAGAVSFEQFQWAYSIVSSRAFAVGETSSEATLLPVIDMANHDPDHPAASIQLDANGGYKLVAVRDIDANTPVSISYGELANAQLLCRYGFVLDEATPFDTILLSSAHVRAVYSQLTDGGSAEGALAQLEYMATDETSADANGDPDGTPSAAKRRKLFSSSKEPVDDLAFSLHGDAAREFGLADGLMSYVFANSLPMESLYDVLTVLLQHKDKSYSMLLTPTSPPADEAVQVAVVRALASHERQVCRRILFGIMSLEEDSDTDDASLDSDEAGDEDDDELAEEDA